MRLFAVRLDRLGVHLSGRAWAPVRRLGEVRRFHWQGFASLTLLAFAYATFMTQPWGTDARGYWSAFQGGLYHTGWQSTAGYSFVYAPPVAMLLWPFTLLPWPVFYATLTAASMAALLWLVGWRWAGFALLLWPFAALDLLNGNIHILMAAALAAGWWPFLLLTKVTPGIGMLVPLLERRWRSLLVTAAVTAGLCLLSILILGVGAWRDWLNLLGAGAAQTGQGHAVQISLAVRLPIAVAFVLAATRWRWLLPFGVLLALPAIWWSSPALLLAIPRLRGSAGGPGPPAAHGLPHAAPPPDTAWP